MTAARNVPVLWHGDEEGPLARRLLSIRMIRFVDFVRRSGALAYRRVSGLSGFEWLLLARACEVPTLSINELAEILNRDVGQVSRGVKRLVSAGLLRSRRRGGGPGVLITPTALGQTVYGPLQTLAEERDAELTRGISSEDLATLTRCIETLTANALDMLAREQSRQDGDQPRAAAAE